YIILDAGDGLYKIDEYINCDKPIYLFLSHLHIDHISGLHILNKFSFSQGISILSCSGYKEKLSLIIDEPFTKPVHELPYNVQLYELPEGEHNRPVKVKCRLLNHSSKCFGYRFDIENKIITYCTDTGHCDAVIELAEDADILITESSIKTNQSEYASFHLNPVDAAVIASKAKAKKLILTHFEARCVSSLEERRELGEEARKVFPETVIAEDGLEIVL
ncbi:MBL fold metallo-hydrolase, partial [Elusimicrobiota bacterium]